MSSGISYAPAVQCSSFEREIEPAWSGTSSKPLPKRAKAKKHRGEDGMPQPGMSCYNCRKQKRKCARATDEACRSFRGMRCDLLQSTEDEAPNPIIQHQLEVESQLSPEQQLEQQRIIAKLSRKRRTRSPSQLTTST